MDSKSMCFTTWMKPSMKNLLQKMENLILDMFEMIFNIIRVNGHRPYLFIKNGNSCDFNLWPWTLRQISIITESLYAPVILLFF
ncbi:hypothetical protein CHS0354_042105 [Potamilus streckersoni]|uniref:Uncharacterized protein n=1 Tax=Potamilus streckersoni TaxID=2493646 RepID=A0AAE0TLS1_9BIVA|nr:hypothetical protein CHS0354_042105 [Potamilus streckersoni]